MAYLREVIENTALADLKVSQSVESFAMSYRT